MATARFQLDLAGFQPDSVFFLRQQTLPTGVIHLTPAGGRSNASDSAEYYQPRSPGGSFRGKNLAASFGGRFVRRQKSA